MIGSEVSQVRGDLTLVVEPPQELQLPVVEGEHHGEELAALGDQLVGPGNDVASRGSAIGPQHGDQLSLHLLDVSLYIGR